MNGLELAGRPIKVGLVNDMVAMPGNGLDRLDDDDGGGMSLNANSRAQLMMRLQRDNDPGLSMLMPPMLPQQSQSSSLQPPIMAPAIPMAAHTFVLKNMFDIKDTADPDFHLDIQEDVTEECSKFGPVMHCSVDRNSMGHVYIKMHTIDAATKAMANLHGRWFGGKAVTAEYVPPVLYSQRFPGH